MKQPAPRYLFFKQTAGVRNYFCELAQDVAAGEGRSLVFSDIVSPPMGGLEFRLGPRYRRNTEAARLLTWARYCMAAAWFAFRVRGRPVLFMIAQPPFLPLLGYLQKKLLGRKYVVWVDDVYPDILIQRGRMRRGGLAARAWAAFNRRVLGAAEHVTTLGPCMMENVRAYLKPDAATSIIPTWVDTEFIRPRAKSENPFAAQHGQQAKLTVMYSGNLGASHDVMSILAAARELRPDARIHFMIIGAGPQWEAIQTAVREHGDTNVTLLPLQPEEMLPYSLATAEIALVSLDKGTEGVSMPSKTYYSMAAGAAIAAISVEQSDLAHVVRAYECGFVAPPGDVEALAAGIRRLAGDPQELERLRQNARRAAEQHYSRAVNTARVRAILSSIR
jgi:glycosyltransferase involved in cell wall biosynthesis